MLVKKVNDIDWLKLIFFSTILLVLNTKIQGQISINSKKYNFINNDRNFLEFDNLNLNPFVEKFKNNKKFIVAHFGDSHVQPDHLTGYIRKELQNLKGDGGRGMIFPYSIAKTYSQADYKSVFSGKWRSANSIHKTPKIPLGISGFSATTSDSNASFKVLFSTSISSQGVSLYITNIESNYEIKLKSGKDINNLEVIKLSPSTTRLNFKIDNKIDSLEFLFHKKSGTHDSLTVRGVYLDKDTTGIIYNNLGVGGAAFESILKQKYFDEEIISIQPDLVVLDWGSNDILYTNCLDTSLPKTIIQTINRVRKLLPTTMILLTSTQDMNRKGVNISVASEFSKMIRKIAFDNGCLLYDWYRVSGGENSMINWVTNQLAREDNIHLTKLGYETKGSLLLDAFNKTIDSVKKNGVIKNLIFENSISDYNDLLLKNCIITPKISKYKPAIYKRKKNIKKKPSTKSKISARKVKVSSKQKK
jgi:hypothetical protein